jgi:hypothetical protein
MYQRLREVAGVDPWDGFIPPPDDTVTAQPKIGVAPLQPPINDPEEDASDEGGFPMFGSSEEAAKPCSKYPWNEWAWWRSALKSRRK